MTPHGPPTVNCGLCTWTGPVRDVWHHLTHDHRPPPPALEPAVEPEPFDWDTVPLPDKEGPIAV